MTEPEPESLSEEQKSALLKKIRNARESLKPKKERLSETVKRTLTWTIEAVSALKLLESSEEKVSGRFETVSRHVHMENLLEDHENGYHDEMPEPTCPECQRNPPIPDDP